MRILIYHGYELSGSGSNEFTAYLAESLAAAGHKTHIVCREPRPNNFTFLESAYFVDNCGNKEFCPLDSPHKSGPTLYSLRTDELMPVYLSDRQHSVKIKSFIDLTDSELKTYHRSFEKILLNLVCEIKPDIIHSNHLVYQPSVALSASRQTETPLIIYPHGSSIEYTVKKDKRFYRAAAEALHSAEGIICGSREIMNRIIELFPELKEELLKKSRTVGVGVDTSLFQPIERIERRNIIKNLKNIDTVGGKPLHLNEKLHRNLEKGNLDIVRTFSDSYKHSEPDEKFYEKLEKIPWDKNIILFVGAITYGKGIQSLMTALPFVLEKSADSHLLIIGSGAYRELLEAYLYALNNSDENLLKQIYKNGQDFDLHSDAGPWNDVQEFCSNKNNLDKLIKLSKGINSNIHFIGRLKHEHLKFLFPCADIAVFPSVIPEAYPLVLMESLANGVLPMVSYFSGFAESLDKLSSYLGNDITDLMKISVDPSERIEQLITNLTVLLNKKLPVFDKSVLRNIAVENFDWKHRAVQMSKAYNYFVEDYKYNKKLQNSN